MNMECSCVQLTDLPNEILLLILNKLTRIEVLYSLIGVHLRLDRILKDPIFTEHLSLIKSSSSGYINPLDDAILDRLCSEILPKIRHQIKWLNLEPLSMENILLATDYPNLHSLSLFNIDYQIAVRLFGEETDLDRIFKNQIATLIITFADHLRKHFPPNTSNIVCADVMTKFNNLRCLKFYPSCNLCIGYIERLSFKSLGPPRFSSNLTTLHINVEDFNDCLYLLDGRFKQLHTFYVNVHIFLPPLSTIVNQETLIHLKCFSLTCNLEIMFYDESIVPVLRRMSNLEELFLNIRVDRFFSSNSFIDGNILQDDIINHMPNLNQFVFSVHSFIKLLDSSHLPSNDDIQRTFKSLENDYQIVSYIDYLPDDKMGRCHIYSYPYTLNSFYRLTNNFPSGYFPFVRLVSLIDHRPFEHEFFLRIAQAFVFLQELSIDNQSPQDQQSDENHSNMSMIDYTHLTVLDVDICHYNYTEQFLDATKTCLGKSIRLFTDYNDLQIVTNNFTRDATRINCAKVEYLDGFEQWNVPSHFYDYFPLLKTKWHSFDI